MDSYNTNSKESFSPRLMQNDVLKWMKKRFEPKMNFNFDTAKLKLKDYNYKDPNGITNELNYQLR